MGYQKGLVCQHCSFRRNHHVPRNRRQNAEGDHRPCPKHNEDQDHCSTREEVLCLDRRIHPRFPLHLPADVDLQAGVRRVRPRHCPQEVLLSLNNSSPPPHHSLCSIISMIGFWEKCIICLLQPSLHYLHPLV